MTLAIEDFVDRFPEFSSLDPAIINRKLDEAARRISFTYLYPRGDDAHGYLTAHLLATSPGAGGTGGAGGQISSVTAGRVTVNYGSSTGASASSLEDTSYGREYLEIVRLVPGLMLI